MQERKTKTIPLKVQQLSTSHLRDLSVHCFRSRRFNNTSYFSNIKLGRVFFFLSHRPLPPFCSAKHCERFFEIESRESRSPKTTSPWPMSSSRARPPANASHQESPVGPGKKSSGPSFSKRLAHRAAFRERSCTRRYPSRPCVLEAPWGQCTP